MKNKKVAKILKISLQSTSNGLRRVEYNKIREYIDKKVFKYSNLY